MVLESGELSEDHIGDAENTHYIFIMDNGKSLGFIGGKQVKYVKVLSSGETLILMVRLYDREKETIHLPMMVLKNHNIYYRIRGVPDTVAGVIYST